MDPLHNLKDFIHLCIAWHVAKEMSSREELASKHDPIHHEAMRQLDHIRNWMRKGGPPPDVRKINNH